MQQSIWRVIVAALVCGVGGLSLTNTFFPIALARVVEEISLVSLANVRGMTLFVALMWAIAGGIVGWYGGSRIGGLVMGICGVASGLLLGIIADSGPLLILVGAGVGLVYGMPGGWLMGRVFPDAAAA